VSSVTAEDIVKLFEADENARRRLAKLLVPEVLTEPNARLAIINAVLRDVATKDDVAKLRDEIEKIRVATGEDIERIRQIQRKSLLDLRRGSRFSGKRCTHISLSLGRESRNLKEHLHN